MSGENLKEEIKTLLVENLMLKVSKEEIADDLPLFGPEGLGLDSIDALELVVSLEKRFGVSVPNSDVARNALATVNSIHDYIIRHKEGSEGVRGVDGVDELPEPSEVVAVRREDQARQ